MSSTKDTTDINNSPENTTHLAKDQEQEKNEQAPATKCNSNSLEPERGDCIMESR